MLARSVIDQARERHSAFDRKRHPDKGALRFLSLFVTTVVGKVMAIDPSALRLDYEVSLPLPDFDAGIALPTNTRLVDAVVGNYPQTGGFHRPIDIDVIDVDQRFAGNHRRAVCWQVKDTLFLRPPAEVWTALASLTLGLVLHPSPLAELDDALALPDPAEPACVEAVAAFFAKREAQETADSPINVNGFTADADKALASYVSDVMTNLSGRVFVTQDVYRP